MAEIGDPPSAEATPDTEPQKPATEPQKPTNQVEEPAKPVEEPVKIEEPAKVEEQAKPAKKPLPPPKFDEIPDPDTFKTHMPGVFSRIQSRLDNTLTEIDAQLEDARKKSPSRRTPDTTYPKRTTTSRSSSVLSSDDPLEIADQCLAEFQGSTLPSPVAKIDVDKEHAGAAKCLQGFIEDRLDKAGVPDEESIVKKSYLKPRPAPMNRVESAPAMIQRGFKTHKPGIFGRIQAQMDSVDLADDEEPGELKPPKPMTTENGSRDNTQDPKRGNYSRSSSVLSSDDPVDVADQCLAEFGSAKISNGSSRDEDSPPRGRSPYEDRVPAIAMNARGFKTHKPGIFGKIASKMDPSAKLFEEDAEEEEFRFVPKPKKMVEEPIYRKPNSFSRSSSILSSDDPVDVADQCLAEFGARDSPIPRDMMSPSRDFVSPGPDFALNRTSNSSTPTKKKPTSYITPNHSFIPKSVGPAPMGRRVSAPNLNRGVTVNSARGFKTHVPGIFGKIQSRLDSKLVDEDDDGSERGYSTQSSHGSGRSTPANNHDPHKVLTDMINKRLDAIEPESFQPHVPDVFNKIQHKMFFSPEISENGEEGAVA